MQIRTVSFEVNWSNKLKTKNELKLKIILKNETNKNDKST